MRETWYIMDDGSVGDPSEIAPGNDGKLVHNDGRAVAYAAHGPRTRGVDAEAERASYKTRESKAEKPKAGGYKTRESKAD